jgi:hypothetical protein
VGNVANGPYRHPAVIQGLSKFVTELLPKMAYPKLMTKLLEKALEAVRQLPPESQDEIARAMLALARNDGEPEQIDPAHIPAVLEGLAQAKRREFVSEAEVEAAFRRFDR